MNIGALVGLLAGIASILSLLYVLFVGQKNLPEIWRQKRLDRRMYKAIKDGTKSNVLHNLPQPDYGEFVGRSKEIDEIKRLLRPYPHSNFHLIMIDGIGGIGKSALTLEVAHQYLRHAFKITEKERFEAIVWVSAKENILSGSGIIHRQSSLSVLDDLYIALAAVLERNEIITARSEERENLIRRALTKQRTLLIIDNLETIKDESIISFLRELPAPTKAIVTTRYRIDVAYPIRLAGISLADAELMVANECRKKGVQLTQEQIKDLYNQTGGVPLALVWSVAQVAFGHNIKSVLSKLHDAKQNIAQFCFDEVISLIREQPSFNIFVARSLFASDPTPEAIKYVAHIHESKTEPDDPMVDLERMSLITKKNQRIAMLPITQQMARIEMRKYSALAAEYITRYIDYYAGFVKDLLGIDFWRSSDAWRNFRLIDGELPNILQAIDLSHQEHKWEQLLSLTVPTVHYLHSRGLFEERLRQAQLAIEAATELRRPDIEAYMRIASIGWIHIRRGEWVKAKHQIELGLAIARESSLSDAIVLAHAHLARIALSQEQLDEAENMLSEVKDTEAAPVIRCRVLFIGGQLEAKRQNWQLAENYLRQAIKLLSTWNDYMWPALYTALGEVLFSTYKLDEAEKVYKGALAFSEEMERKTDIADAWFGLARIAQQKGRFEDADQMAETALKLFQLYRSEREVNQVKNFIQDIQRTKQSPFKWLVMVFGNIHTKKERPS